MSSFMNIKHESVGDVRKVQVSERLKGTKGSHYE